MSEVKLKYEILVSGLYPLEEEFRKNGFVLRKNKLNQEMLDSVYNMGLIYLSPYIVYCCCPDGKGNMLYLTFEKELTIDIDYGDSKEYDVPFTNQVLIDRRVFKEVEDLEKIMILEINNSIKFPIKMIKAYDASGKFVTMYSNFTNPNTPSLLNVSQPAIMETIARQTYRLSSGISYEKITELKANNTFFDNALSMYYSSFTVSDEKVSFILLVTALEALISKGTYSKVENCKKCGQPMYKIIASVSENVSTMLMDTDESIKKHIKALYKKRSKFLHEGIQDITKQDEQDMQEYVRKVLLMYWCVSLRIDTYKHEDIMKEILSDNYNSHLMYKTFLTCLGNASFQDKQRELFKDIFKHLIREK